MNFFKDKSKIGKILALAYVVAVVILLGLFVVSWIKGCVMANTHGLLDDGQQKSCALVGVEILLLTWSSAPFLFFLIFFFYYIGLGIEYLVMPENRGVLRINKKLFAVLCVCLCVSVFIPLQLFFPQFNLTSIFRKAVPCSPQKQVNAMVVFKEPVAITEIGAWEEQFGLTAYNYKPDVGGVSGNINRREGESFDDFLSGLKVRYETIFSHKIEWCEKDLQRLETLKKGTEEYDLSQQTAIYCKEDITEAKKALEIVKVSGPTIIHFQGNTTLEHWNTINKKQEIEDIFLDDRCTLSQ